MRLSPALLAFALASCSSEPPSQKTTQARKPAPAPARASAPKKTSGQEAREEEERLKRLADAERRDRELMEKIEREKAEKRRREEEKRAGEERDRAIRRDIDLLPRQEAEATHSLYRKLKKGTVRTEGLTGLENAMLRTHRDILDCPELRQLFRDSAKEDGTAADVVDLLGLKGTRKEPDVLYHLGYVMFGKDGLGNLQAIHYAAKAVDRAGGLKNVSRVDDQSKDIIRTYREIFVSP